MSLASLCRWFSAGSTAGRRSARSARGSARDRRGPDGSRGAARAAACACAAPCSFVLKERENGVQDMDCGRVAGGEVSSAANGGGPYGGQWPEDAGWMQGDINYMKGGGKGWGKYGERWGQVGGKSRREK